MLEGTVRGQLAADDAHTIRNRRIIVAGRLDCRQLLEQPSVFALQQPKRATRGRSRRHRGSGRGGRRCVHAVADAMRPYQFGTAGVARARRERAGSASMGGRPSVEAAQHLGERFAHLRMLEGEVHRRFEKTQLGTAIEAPPLEPIGEDRLAEQQSLQTVGELKLLAASGAASASASKMAGLKR